MSKKLVLAAVLEARAGRLDAAVILARSVRDAAFVRRRLEHYKSQPDQREAAYLLEAALAASEKPSTGDAAILQPTFTALLPPSGAIAAPRGHIDFDHPESFLLWASGNWDEIEELNLDELNYTDVWALVALGALSLEERTRRPPVVRHAGLSSAARFAHALGFDRLAGGDDPTTSEPQRTVQLTRVRTRAEIEPVAARMASLLLPGEDSHDANLAVRYVLVELLRNVVQHSQDPLGAIVAAQRMDSGQHRSRVMVQVAVADAGIGIPRTLQREHPHLTDYRQALERALLPHISGTFREGLTGSIENAGLGLYVISEMARRTGGRLLIATTGAALVLQGSAGPEAATPRFLHPIGLGFPGTLAAFEIPTDAVEDYRSLISAIVHTAGERTPKRASSNWLVFSPAAADAIRVAVASAREDTLAAAQIAEQAIRPAVLARRSIEISFADLELCTQSWLHALLYEPVRLAWAMRVPIHVVGADPAVREGLRFLEAYALGG